MKKHILFSMVLAASMAACTSDYTDWAKPLQSAVEEAKSGTYVTTSVDAIKIADVTGDSVNIFNSRLNIPAGTDITESTVTFDETQTINISTSGKVSVADLVSAVEALYGKAPNERTLSGVATVYYSDNGQAMRAMADKTEVKVSLSAPFISSSYYLIGDMVYTMNGGSKSNWNAENLLKFNHSDKNVYDDPEFTVVFTTDAADQYWKIMPYENINLENIWDPGVVGTIVDGDTSLSGKLTTDNPKAGKIEEPGIYRMTLNMMEYTYKIEKLNFKEFFYEIGGESTWGVTHALYGKNFDGKYQGYYYLDSEFKFRPNADNWEGDYEFNGEGKISDNGGSNCPAPEAAFYQIDVDLAAGTYALTAVKSITMVGTHNSWNVADAATHMTYNKEENCWQIEYTFAEQTSLKFAMNDDWTVSWGGANGDASNYGNLTQNNGKDLSVAAGTYLIKLYLSYEGANKVTFTPKN
ncbi:protein of unknown function [Bacteroidales bacterium KHT7]|nr:protein of unknown function [Bacteroidales bacterium KHT7]